MCCPVADDKKPFSEIVREYGTRQADNTLHRADEWRTWAEQLDELIRELPLMSPPWVHTEDADTAPVEMGAGHVDRSAMRRRLYRLVADADAVAAALTRAAVIAENRSDELANAFAIDEAEGTLVPVDTEPVEIPPGHLPCPECSAGPYRPHDADCPTLLAPVSPQTLVDLLGLVCVTVTEETVCGWTEEQRRQAERWASATHLSASDNDVVVPNRPGFLGGESRG